MLRTPRPVIGPLPLPIPASRSWYDLEDLRYAPLIEDEDLLVGLDKLRREVGLYVAEADDQVRIQVTDLFDIPVNERGDDWMVIPCLGWPYGVGCC